MEHTLNNKDRLKNLNSLIELLHKHKDFDKKDFEYIETVENSFPKSKFVLRAWPEYYFTYQETPNVFHGEFYPPVHGSKAQTYNHQKGKRPEIAYDFAQQNLKSWLKAVLEERNEIERRTKLLEAMKPDPEVYDEKEMKRSFTKNQKIIFKNGILEFIFKIKLTKWLTSDRKNMMIDIANVSLLELENIDTLEEGEEIPQLTTNEGGKQFDYETKESFINRFKARINKAMGKVKDFFKEVIYDLAKDYMKDILKGTVMFALYHTFYSPASQNEKKEVYIVFATSLHFIEEPPIPLLKEPKDLRNRD